MRMIVWKPTAVEKGNVPNVMIYTDWLNFSWYVERTNASSATPLHYSYHYFHCLIMITKFVSGKIDYQKQISAYGFIKHLSK